MTIITTARPWPEPLFLQGLLETHRGPACCLHDRAWGQPGATGQASGEVLELGAAARGERGRGRLRGSSGKLGRRPASALGGCPPPSPLPFYQLPGNSLGLPCPGLTPAHREPAAAGSLKLPLPPPAARRHPCTHQRGSLASPVAPALTRRQDRSPARRHAAPGDRACTGCRRRAGGARPGARTPGCSTALRPPGGSSSERPAGGARPGAAPALQCRALRAERPSAPRTWGGSGVSLPGGNNERGGIALQAPNHRIAVTDRR